MSDVRIDGERLRAAVAHIDAVVDSFAAAGSEACEAVAFVGHEGLAHCVRDFAAGWDIHRGELTQNLGELAAMFEAVADAFADVEDQLAAAVNADVSHQEAPQQGVVDPVPSLTQGRDT